MPKDNNQTPVTPTTNSDDQSPVFMEETLPPMPQEAPITQDITPVENKQDTEPNETPVETPIMDSGSAAPQDEVIMPPTVTSKNKKKFAGGKVIATILGLFLLIGGVGAGVLLVKQNQNISEKAATDCNSITNSATCVATSACSWKPEVTSQCSASNCVATGGNYTVGCSPTAIVPAYCKGIQSCQGLNKFECIGVCVWVEESKPLCKGTYVVTKGECYSTTNQLNECEDMGGICRRNSCNTDENQISQTCVEGSQDICCKTKATTIDCSQIKCNVGDTTCTVGGLKSSTCYVNHYVCDEVVSQCGGTPYKNNVASSSLFTTCGTEQIDLYCKECGLVNEVGSATCLANPSTCQKYTYRRNSNACTTTPTDESAIASCSNIKAYTESWVLIPQSNLSGLSVGDKINLCVTGTSTGGSFDMARFKVNGVTLPDTTTKRPGSSDYCYLYTIPTGTTTFNIVGQIHHTSLGWK